jgi:hypothetical protein
MPGNPADTPPGIGRPSPELARRQGHREGVLRREPRPVPTTASPLGAVPTPDPASIPGVQSTQAEAEANWVAG